MDRTTTWIAALFIVGIAISCDKPPPPPPAADESSSQSEPKVEDRRPAADDVMNGRWRMLQLGIHPLRIQAPEQWDVKGGTTTFLRGPTPSGPLPEGEINIAVSKPPFPKEVANQLIEEGRKKWQSAASSAAAAAPSTSPTLEHTAIRELGPAHVLEQRTVVPPKAGLPEMLRWTVLVFVPVDAKTVNSYQLSFMDLTTDHYRKDREILERIVNSLELDASAMIALPATTPPKPDPLR